MKIVPVEFKVLIKPDEVKDKSNGGLFMPENTREREQEAIDRGTLEAANDMAFSDWKGRKPIVGEKVIFNKYAGSILEREAADYETTRKKIRFRLCNDKDICAIIEEE